MRGSRAGGIALAAIVAGLATTAGAQEAPTYFSGTHVCNGTKHYDDWRISQAPDGSWAAEVFYRSSGYSSFQGIELSGKPDDSGFLLSDKNKRPRIGALMRGSELRGVWLGYDGKPSRDCETFVLRKTDSVQARYDEMFRIMAIEAPTPEDAGKLGGEVRIQPPLALLPELDQTAYRQKFRDLSQDFWSRYMKTALAKLQDMPLETASDQKTAVEFLRAATGFDVTPDERYGASSGLVSFAVEAQRVLAARLEDKGVALKGYDLSDQQGLCQRLAQFSYVDMDNLELVVGRPALAWDRPYADQLLQQVQGCKNGSNVVGTLKTYWPRVEQAQANVTWLKQERDKLLALPVTLDAYRSSNWLTVDRDALNSRSIDRGIVDRVLNAPLEARRAEMQTVAMQAIDKSFADATEATLPADKARERCTALLGEKPWSGTPRLAAMWEHCEQAANAYGERVLDGKVQVQVDKVLAAPKTIEGLAANNWFMLDTSGLGYGPLVQKASATFNTKVGAARTEAMAAAERELGDKFAAIDPVAQDQAPVEKQCLELGGVYEMVNSPLSNTCRTLVQALAGKRRAARCDNAVKTSGVSDDMLKASIELTGALLPNNAVPMKEWICEADRQGTKLVFGSSGMFWKSYTVGLRSRQQPDGPAALTGTLEQVEGKSNPDVWRVSAIEVGSGVPEADAKRIRDTLKPEKFVECAATNGRAAGCF